MEVHILIQSSSPDSDIHQSQNHIFHHFGNRNVSGNLDPIYHWDILEQYIISKYG